MSAPGGVGPAITAPTVAEAAGSLPERLVATARARPTVVDGALAVLVAVLGVLYARSGGNPQALHDVGSVVAVVVAAPLALRRRFPLPVAIAVAVIGAIAVLTLNAFLVVPAALVAAYSVTVYGPAWAGPTAAALLVVGALAPLAVGLLSGAAQVGTDGGVLATATVLSAVVATLIALCTWLAGALRRAGRRRVVELVERARLLEDGRRQEVALELLAERARISREVHDIVGHALSGIVARADGARYAAQDDPQRALGVLDEIAGSGREALGDIRSLLSTLRDAVPDGGAGAAPTVDDVGALVEQVRAGGLPVELTTVGEPRTLPAGAEVTVYRAVQEALTNVLKHAGPDAATRVVLSWADAELHLEVDDDGSRTRPFARRSRPAGAGHGLNGMRERAALHGGRAEAGPRPGGGFAVRVALPYAARP